MQTILVKHGNGLALVIDEAILDQLGADAGTQFTVTTDGQTLILTPAPAPERSKVFRDSLNKTNSTYAEDLKRLAE